MSAVASKAVSPETVRKFTIQPAPNSVAMELRMDELEKKVRSLAKAAETIDGLRRQIAHLNGFMLTVNHGRGGKGAGNRDQEIEAIVRYVADQMGCDVAKLWEYSRKDPSVREARKIAMWTVYQFRPYVIRDIARVFRRKDHATVWHAIRSLDDKQVAKAQKLLDDYRRIYHAEAETAPGFNGASSKGQGLAATDERAVSGTDGERKA